jgi:hypothetical protein
MQIVYQNQQLNVPQWKLTSDTLTILVELSSAACCISVLSKIRGYHTRSMPMGMVSLYDYRLDGPAIREPNLEIDD